MGSENPKIRQYDSPLRLLVPSSKWRRGADPYLVDLANYRGNGECDCEHFRMRLEPWLKDGKPPGDEYRCKHIKRARVWFLNRTIAILRHNEVSGL